jgi:hypothetical protein
LAEGINLVLAAPERARARAIALRDMLVPRFDWSAVAAAYARSLRSSIHSGS